MFDPYYKWLGIPPDEQPPNHYRLLGIRLFEPDLEVINAAVVQRSQYVRNFQTGKCVEQATRILNEIAAGGACLTDPARRAKYDAELKQQAARSKSASTNSLPPAPAPLIDPFLEQLAAAPAAPWASPLAPQRAPRKSGIPFWQLAAAVGGTVVVVLSIVVFAMSRRGDRSPAESDAASASSASAPVIGAPAASISRAAEPDVVSAPALRTLEVIENSVGMKLVLISAGEFDMGSPESEIDREADENIHHVRLTRDFLLGQTEVTQAQYERVMGANPSYFSRMGEGKDYVIALDTSAFPTEQVSWEKSGEFCQRLSALPAEKAAGRVYELPTEAEWEYACRAGTTTVFSYGDSLSSAHANFDGRNPYGGAETGRFLNRPTSVGSYKPNAFTLLDMHGNVWEWCADNYVAYPGGVVVVHPVTGPSSDHSRCLRGGGWNDSGSYCRAAARHYLTASDRGYTVGFRVACRIGPARP
jgi:formylglycine-generating enzyme required for sulfatase activity